jgi:hypothetical protein
MGGGKSKKKTTKVVVVPEGLQIQDDKKFYKDICAALLPVIGPVQLTSSMKPWGQRCMVYIRQPNSPVVTGREGPVPALELFLDDRQSAWLVVELESEYGGGPLLLKHVSLKLWQGSTIETAHLCFRAEWDVRDSNLSHAQPHWNVHAPRGLDTDPATEDNFRAFSDRELAHEPASFAEFVQAEVGVAVQAVPIKTQDFGLTAQHLHKFHFAMAANWHVNDGRTGPVISSTQEVVNWISSCARYIKHQFTFVIGG